MEDTEGKNNEQLMHEKEEEGFCSKKKIALFIIVCFIFSIVLVILAIIVYLAKDYGLSPLEVYEKYDKIGNITVGDNSVVYKAKNKNTSEIVSIKEIKLSKTKIRDEVKNDILFTQALHNYTKKSIEIKDIFEQRSTKFIVTEYYDEDLSVDLNNTKKGFDVDKIKNIMKQINEILKVLRDKNIVHHNIKLESILVQLNNSNNENEFEIKLGNFSQAKLLSPDKKKWENIKPYEDYDDKEYNQLVKQDLLDIGKEIYRMFFNEKNINKDNINIDKIGDDNLVKLLKGLLENDVEKRIKWEDYFIHPFFNDDNETSSDYKNFI